MNIYIIAMLIPITGAVLVGYIMAKDEVNWVCLPRTPEWRKVSLSTITFDAIFGNFFFNGMLIPLLILISIFLQAQPLDIDKTVLGSLLGWIVGFAVVLVSSFTTALCLSYIRKKPIGWYHA